MLRFKRDVPQRERDLQDSVTRALDQMVYHQRTAERLSGLGVAPVIGPVFRWLAAHHFEMAQCFRKLAGELWQMWQEEIRAREALTVEFEQVAANAWR